MHTTQSLLRFLEHYCQVGLDHVLALCWESYHELDVETRAAELAEALPRYSHTKTQRQLNNTAHAVSGSTGNAGDSQDVFMGKQQNSSQPQTVNPPSAETT